MFAVRNMPWQSAGASTVLSHASAILAAKGVDCTGSTTATGIGERHLVGHHSVHPRVYSDTEQYHRNSNTQVRSLQTFSKQHHLNKRIARTASEFPTPTKRNGRVGAASDIIVCNRRATHKASPHWVAAVVLCRTASKAAVHDAQVSVLVFKPLFTFVIGLAEGDTVRRDVIKNA
jgi:hypothetical protein